MGCIVLGFGIYVLAAGQDIAQLIKEGAGEAIPLYSSAAILLIILSLLIIIVTFFGCCGALKENKCMLGTYFAIVLVFFIIFIVAAIIGYTQSEEKIQEPLKKAVKSYGMANKTKITDAWNYVQKEVNYLILLFHYQRIIVNNVQCINHRYTNIENKTL